MNSWRKNPNIYSRQPRRGSVEALMRRINALEDTITGSDQYTLQSTSSGSFNPVDAVVDLMGDVHVLAVSGTSYSVVKYDSALVSSTTYGAVARIGNGISYYNSEIYVSSSLGTSVQIRKYDLAGVLLATYNMTTGVPNRAIRDIAFDGSGRPHCVIDTLNVVNVYNSSFSTVLHSYATGGITPTNISTSPSGDMHVYDQSTSSAYAVRVFSDAGVYLYSYAPVSSSPGIDEVYQVSHVANDPYGNSHVYDSSQDVIKVYDASGVYAYQYPLPVAHGGPGVSAIDGAVAFSQTTQGYVFVPTGGPSFTAGIYEYTSAFSQTTFSLYTRNGTPVSLGTPDAGVSVPSPYALSDYPAWLHPQHIVDMRTAIQAMASYFNNPATGNPYNFTGGSADNLYYVAMGDRRAYGGSRGPRYTWTRTGLEMLGTPTYDIDIGEIHECVRQLEAS